MFFGKYSNEELGKRSELLGRFRFDNAGCVSLFYIMVLRGSYTFMFLV